MIFFIVFVLRILALIMHDLNDWDVGVGNVCTQTETLDCVRKDERKIGYKLMMNVMLYGAERDCEIMPLLLQGARVCYL